MSIKEQPFLPSREKCSINVAAMNISFIPPPKLQRRLERAEEDTGISQQKLCEDSIRSAKEIIELLASREPIFFCLRDHLPKISINGKGDDFSEGQSRRLGGGME